MKGKNLVVVAMALALSLVAALALSACNSSPASSEASGGESSSGEGASLSPVYLLTKATYYDNKGNLAKRYEYERDERGGATSTKAYDASGQPTRDQVLTFDSNGNLVHMGSGPEDPDSFSLDATNEVEEGRLVKTVAENEVDGSIQTDTYSYHKNGLLKAHMGEVVKQDGRKAGNASEYDADGFNIRYSAYRDDQLLVQQVFEWQKDPNGNPSRVTIETTQESGKTTRTLTVQCDAYGNISRVYNEDGTLYAEFEYVIVDNPSQMSWTAGQMKTLIP